MGYMLGKLDGKYFEWSTIVDAPTIYDATLAELTAYIKEEYGAEGMRQLPARLARVEQFGTSAHPPYRDGLVEEMRQWLKKNGDPK